MAGVVDTDDVGVVDGRQEAGLSHEALEGLWFLAPELGVEDLDGYLDSHLGVHSPKHGPHGADSDWRQARDWAQLGWNGKGTPFTGHALKSTPFRCYKTQKDFFGIAFRVAGNASMPACFVLGAWLLWTMARPHDMPRSVGGSVGLRGSIPARSRAGTGP